jgi:hypothetical protein
MGRWALAIRNVHGIRIEPNRLAVFETIEQVHHGMGGVNSRPTSHVDLDLMVHAILVFDHGKHI